MKHLKVYELWSDYECYCWKLPTKYPLYQIYLEKIMGVDNAIMYGKFDYDQDYIYIIYDREYTTWSWSLNNDENYNITENPEVTQEEIERYTIEEEGNKYNI